MELKTYSIEELWRLYTKFQQDGAMAKANKINDLVLSRQALIRLTQESYNKLPEATFRKTVIGDWKCGGECSKCIHKNRDTRYEMANWIKGLAKWNIFITVTFNTARHIAKQKKGTFVKWDMIGERFVTEAWYNILEYLEERQIELGYTNVLNHIDFVAGLEQQSRGDYHIHALLGNIRISKLDEVTRWKQELDRDYGWTSIYFYEESKGAEMYLCKYLTKDGNFIMRINSQDIKEVERGALWCNVLS